MHLAMSTAELPSRKIIPLGHKMTITAELSKNLAFTKSQRDQNRSVQNPFFYHNQLIIRGFIHLFRRTRIQAQTVHWS
jgi:hypothetical protein